jgi:hypothetical protein
VGRRIALGEDADLLHRHPRLAKCYAATHQGATALAGAVSDAVHHVGPRVSTGGVLVWASFDDGSEGGTKDPDTDQPMASVVISITAATQLATP